MPEKKIMKPLAIKKKMVDFFLVGRLKPYYNAPLIYLIVVILFIGKITKGIKHLLCKRH